ncbi:hypothetical protein VCHA43P273_20194 [Vibrio chagasii]|nr:hypothetical protein VCHA43P273_20194 [Vibrio chagasii]CAH7427375.1 hypothetical protein VCHA53O474_50185 [Vibrio chagasii]
MAVNLAQSLQQETIIYKNSKKVLLVWISLVIIPHQLLV